MSKRSSAARKKKSAKKSLARAITRTHRGMVWESYTPIASPSTAGLWSCCPWAPHDFTSFNVYDHSNLPDRLNRGSFHLSPPGGHQHRCKTLEDAFEQAWILLHKGHFLALLEKRADWRIRELERRFGDRLT